ncbi:MAG TPA: hypothetical protein VFE62_07900 [Gemmataceae bacterium]|nr:hypothetical protein [Gemmataceae bacterium]
MNDINRTQSDIRWLSYASIGLGILGAVFFWWVPMGIVLSIAGILFGFVDWMAARRRSLDFRFAIAGVILSAAALAFCCVIAALGWQALTFGGW